MNSNKPEVHRHYACWRCGPYHPPEELKGVAGGIGRVHKYCARCAEWVKARAERRAKQEAKRDSQ